MRYLMEDSATSFKEMKISGAAKMLECLKAAGATRIDPDSRKQHLIKKTSLKSQLLSFHGARRERGGGRREKELREIE